MSMEGELASGQCWVERGHDEYSMVWALVVLSRMDNFAASRLISRMRLVYHYPMLSPSLPRAFALPIASSLPSCVLIECFQQFSQRQPSRLTSIPTSC